MAKVGFVSEAGAHGFSFESAGNAHFSVTVVLVDEQDKRRVEEGTKSYNAGSFWKS